MPLSNLWTLEHRPASAPAVAGTLRTFAAWGLGDAQRTLVNQGVDSLSFVQDGALFDGNALFNERDIVIAKRGGVRVFYGRVEEIPRDGTEVAESLAYGIAGPWLWLDKIPFQQSWQTTNGVTSALIAVNKPRVIFSQKSNGTKANLNEGITEVLAWAIARGAPLAIGTLPAYGTFTVPYDEQANLTCGEALRYLLRWMPDAITFFDYGTEPYPTLHIHRRGDAATVSFTVGTKPLARVSGIRARTDLQKSGVYLVFEKENSVDDNSWTTQEVDKYPAECTGEGLDDLVAVVELQGKNTTLEKQYLRTRAIEEEDEDWWKDQVPELQDALEFEIEADSGVVTAVVEGQDPKPSYVVEGAVPSWLAEDRAAEVEVRCTARVVMPGPAAGQKLETLKQILRCNVTSTNLSSGTKSRVSSSSPAEPTPLGMAQQLYNALSVLQWEGQITLQEEECTLSPAPGKLLNILGSKAAWATMAAQIQQVSEHWDSGQTTFAFGPAAHLGPQDLIELLRAFRKRAVDTRRNVRVTGTSGGGAETEGNRSRTLNSGSMGSPTILRDEAGNTLELTPTQLKLYDASGNGVYLSVEGWVQLIFQGKEIYIDPSDMAGAFAGMRQYEGCESQTFDALGNAPS